MEAQPVQFFQRDAAQLVNEARQVVADFLGADPAGLAFVNNATSGINAVLRSFPWSQGDEILVLDHGYPACLKTVSYVQERWETRTVVAQ